MNRKIVDYYDRLAPAYDQERFENSYGAFIDAEERGVLNDFLPFQKNKILDLGCGTGRLSDHAFLGCDPSYASLIVAAKRRPSKSFVAADGRSLPFPSDTFDGVFLLHVLMHLDIHSIQAIFREVFRVLVPGGIFIADILSAFRRRMRPRVASEWHGNTAISRSEFSRIGAAAGLNLDRIAGIALLPVHRLPESARRYLHSADRRAAAILPELSQYIVGRFIKPQ